MQAVQEIKHINYRPQDGLKTPDFKTSIRDSECRVTNNSGKMFIQFMIGQKVSDSKGSDVVKFSAISFTMPDIFSKGMQIIADTAVNNKEFANLVRNLASFNEENSLLGGFTSSSYDVGAGHLKIVSDLYESVERAVRQTQQYISKEEMKSFNKAHSQRKSKLKNLINDAKFIFSNPEHGGSIAYRNAEKFGSSLFRMEWLMKDGEIITRGTPKDGYPISKVTAGIAKDQGDKDFINAMLEYFSSASNNGARSIMGFQMNSTATIGKCGALDTEALANAAIAAITNPSATVSFGLPAPVGSESSGSNFSSNSSSTTTSSANTGAGDGSSNTNKAFTCSNCGKMNDPPTLVCSCMQRLSKLHHH